MLNIANIQQFSVGDGDGIRTTVFFKGCNLKCPWCHNPESIPTAPTTLRWRDRTEVCGRQMTPQEVLREILDDRDYYTESGGGATFSGGEVLLQAAGAAELAAMLADEQIPLVIDTAGCVAYKAFELLNPYTDTYLFDFKTADGEKYRRVIGGDPALITENLRRLLAEGKRVRVRIPLIPDFNTADDDVDAICGAMADLGVRSVDLLPFHRMGSGKYTAMGKTYAYADRQPLYGAELEPIVARFRRSLTVKVEG